jgi:eukaryotic-like serine/threonine-protein kinase
VSGSPPFSNDRWQIVSPYLDRALEMDGDERARWLASLRDEDPALAADLQMLLDEGSAAGEERFLENGGGLPRPPSASLAGQTIGSYTLDSPIGHGGMGSVWLARRSDGRYEGMAAVKLLSIHLVGRAAEERFRREGSILARLTHPHIARLIDAGTAFAGQPYLVLEHVEGEHIDRYCDGRGLSVEARLRLFLDVLAAVAHAHASLVVHRDIKPSNVLVSSGGQVKLLDFGIAKLLEADAMSGEATALTRDGGAVLTPEYAAPEQVTGEPITTATDVYALGVLLYVLLGGRHPAGGAARHSTVELLRAIVDGNPQRISEAVVDARTETAETLSHNASRRASTPDQLRRVLRGDLDTIVAKALKRGPEERYPSVTAMADDLRRYQGHQPISARPDTAAYRMKKFARRNRLALAAALLAALGLATGMVLALWQARIAGRERDRAREIAEQARREATRAERVAELLGGVFDAASPFEHPGPLEARDLLERGGAQVARRLEHEPEMRAQIATMLADVWLRLGEDERAAALLEPAVADLERLRGRFDPATARAWSSLARLRRRQGRNAEARDLLERALAVQRATVGAADRNTLKTLEGYGLLLRTEGDFEGARKALTETIAGYERLGDDATVELAMATGNLGIILQRLEDWSGAERAHRRAYETLVKVYGADSPRAALSLSNLADVLSHFGRHAEARAALEEVLRVNQKVFGDAGIPGESVHRNSLAWAHLDSGDAVAARAEFRRAVAAAERERGPGHPDAGWPLRGLAETELKLRHLDEARAAFERALAIRTKFWGRQHWEVAQSLNDLAGLAAKRGDRTEQERLLREALAIRRAAHPRSHPEVARAVIGLGAFLCAHRGTPEGAALLAEGLALAGSAERPLEPEAKQAKAMLATCSQRLKMNSSR